MARLSAAEFEQLIEELAQREGLGKLQEKLLRTRALVSRRRLGSTQALARQLYQLTLGLERESFTTRVLLALWEELLGSKVDESASAELEGAAAKINECLDESYEVAADRAVALQAALGAYQASLAARVGENAARITMLMRAYPSVARVLRGS